MSAPFEQSPALSAIASVRHGFFGRTGGHSQGDFASNNMSVAVGDRPHLAEANRAGAAQSLGYLRKNLYLLKQVHSATVRILTEYPDNNEPFEADAMVTNLPVLALGILTADCTPILFTDAEAGVIGAAHAGWKGAASSICENTIMAMVALGAKIDRIVAAIGPTISGPNYEVGPQFMTDFVQIRPDAWRYFVVPTGKRTHFDLPGFIEASLREAGVQTIDHVGLCTYAHPDRYFSHRHATHHGTRTGRQVSIIGLA